MLMNLNTLKNSQIMKEINVGNILLSIPIFLLRVEYETKENFLK